MWRPCKVLEEINGPPVLLRFRCGEKIKDTRRLAPFVASLADQCCTVADFAKWKGSTAQFLTTSELEKRQVLE